MDFFTVKRFGYVCCATKPNMRFKMNVHKLTALLVTVFVMSSPFKAYSQNQCSSLFSKPSVYGESFPYLKKLDNSNVDLIEALVKNPKDIDSVTVDQKIAELAVLAEQYFKANDIKFEKLSSSIGFKSLKDTDHYSTFYPIYRLKGSKDGDEISRLMYGAQSNSKNEGHPLKIVFDLFYQIKFPDSSGHFNPESITVNIGSHVISQEIAGLSTILRHEIQHYFEQVKVLTGKMTLARITCSEAFPKESGPYSSFLRIDELETHLRDLRSLLNNDLMESKDNKLVNVITSEENMKVIKKLRPPIAKKKFKRILKLIEDSKLALNNIEGLGPSSIFLNNKTGGIEVSFVFLPAPYSILKIELLGLLGKENDIKNKQKIDESVKQIVDWSRLRIQQIENEVKLLAFKLHPE